jgi:UDP-N-acetylglucosamine 2-epimerase
LFFISDRFQQLTRNAHSELLAEQVQKRLVYKSGTEMFEKMNENRRKIQKKKTLLAELKRWAKQRKTEYLQFHKNRAKTVLQQIEMRINGYINMEDSPNRSANLNNEPVNLLCEEE